MPTTTRGTEAIQEEEARELLTRRREQLMGRMASDAAPAVRSRETLGADRAPGDAGDRALRDLAEEDRLHDAARASARLKLIDAAWARLGVGTYGLCTDCGEPIAPRRLRSIPEVLRCVNCQELYDRDHPTGEHHATL